MVHAGKDAVQVEKTAPVEKIASVESASITSASDRVGIADADDDAALGDAAITPDEIWPRVLELAKPRLRAMLESMTLLQAGAKVLKLGVPAARSAMARDHLSDIVRLVQETGARSVSIQIIDLKPNAGAASHEHPENDHRVTDPSEAQDAATSQTAAAPPDADDHPLVREAARIFNAKVTHVHPKRR